MLRRLVTRKMGEQVRVLHLLCKHEDSRNPISRRTGQSVEEYTKEQAHATLRKYHTELEKYKGEELVKAFREAAEHRSDCGSFAHGGDLNFFTRGQMQKPFEEKSFSLQVGELSDIVETDSGSHLILRIE